MVPVPQVDEQSYVIRAVMRHNLSPILDSNPTFQNSSLNFAMENLSELYVELVSSFIYETALPVLGKELNEMGEDKETQIGGEHVLKQYGLTKLCISTVYCWLVHLGIEYLSWTKNYYILTIMKHQKL